jgi:hypothetical protein
MRHFQLVFPVVAVAAALIGCSVGGTGAAPSAQPPIQTPQPISATTDTPSVGQEPPVKMVQAPINPCDLVPQDEASTLANYQFDVGSLEDDPNGGQRCVYGSQSTNVMSVLVAQASDPTTAQGYRDKFVAEMQSQAAQLAANGLVVTEVPDFADGAVQATLDLSIGGMTISGSAFGFLKGDTFVGISDVTRGQPAPTIDALKAEANTVIGRLP